MKLSYVCNNNCKKLEFSQIERKKDKMIRIVFISDTHTCHHQLPIPNCDILVHCGDMSFRGVDQSDVSSKKFYTDFNNWLGKVAPGATKIVIAGNHDTYLEKIGATETKKLLSNAIYLQNSFVRLFGLSIFGSPASNETSKRNKAFQNQKYISELQTILREQTKEVDILVTHSCNVVPKEIIQKLGCKIHSWGHFHHDYGVKREKINQYEYISLGCSSIEGINSNKVGPIVVDLAI